MSVSPNPHGTELIRLRRCPDAPVDRREVFSETVPGDHVAGLVETDHPVLLRSHADRGEIAGHLLANTCPS
jgi:hypothetical protein